MTRRSRAREVALQLLYQHDFNPSVAAEDVLRFLRDRLPDEALQAYCRGLYEGVLAQQTAIDDRLSQSSRNWRLTRMTPVDRNVLRLGAYELLFAGAPPGVAISEAIELARRYGAADSPAFVNGILDSLPRRSE